GGPPVEPRRGKPIAARREAVADHLMRIRLANKRGPSARRRGAAGEARHREIEPAPEKMHRAALAEELASTTGEDALRLQHDSPHAVGVVGIVRVVNRVLLEWNGMRHFDG